MLLIVGALSSELRSLGAPPPRGVVEERGGVSILRTGPGLERARAAAQEIAALRPTIVLHVGLAGGLRSGLGMGDLVLVTATSREVLSVDRGGSLPEPVEAFGVASLRPVLARLPDRMAQGAILTVDRFVPDAKTKEAIGRAGPYLACEMEAAPLATAAAACGARYIGLRSISDPCDVDVLPSLRSPSALLRFVSRPDAAMTGYRSVKGVRRASAALARALPVALAAVQAMSSISRPASATNSWGT